jgi:LDH2 family malate/lactate/ureidoglycolate dehydrogenase
VTTKVELATARQVARFPLERLQAYVEEVLVALGLGRGDAAEAADVLLLADLRGVDSHGLARLSYYANRLRRGLIAVDAELRVLRESAATLALDAANGFGLIQAPRAMARCLEKAEASGLCFATVRGSNHFGIAAAYALMAARRGLGGIAMTNASPLVVPTFGARPMLGTNPIAIAVPTGSGPDAPPLVLDMATSTVAWGKIQVARQDGAAIPAGWAVDEDGRPTTDPFAARWLTPLGGERSSGGHKGYALATMVDVLCGPLAGAAWSAHISGMRGPEVPAAIGHAFLAWRIDAFRDPEEFFLDLGAMLAELRATPPIAGHEATGVLVPGDPELAAEAGNRALGVPVRAAVLADLRRLADELGLTLPFEIPEALEARS